MAIVTSQPQGPWIPPAYARKEQREASWDGPSGLVSSNPVPSLLEDSFPADPVDAPPEISPPLEEEPPLPEDLLETQGVIHMPQEDPIFQEESPSNEELSTAAASPSWQEEPSMASAASRRKEVSSPERQMPVRGPFVPTALQRDTTLILLMLVLVLEEPQRNESLLFALCYLLL